MVNCRGHLFLRMLCLCFPTLAFQPRIPDCLHFTHTRMSTLHLIVLIRSRISHVSDFPVLAGYRGRLCETEIDPCLSQPCRNGATCNSLDGGSYSCTCPLGTTGLYCGVDINECESQPCQNGGQCSQPGLGSFQCACEPGYTGNTCETGELGHQCCSACCVVFVNISACFHSPNPHPPPPRIIFVQCCSQACCKHHLNKQQCYSWTL